MKAKTSLVLRVCRPDLTSRNGFAWPSEIGAKVEAPDWEESNSCGNGIHGWQLRHRHGWRARGAPYSVVGRCSLSHGGCLGVF